MINCSLIGCGYWGPNYIRAINELPDIKLKWACDLDKNKLNKISSAYPLIKFTADYKEILNDEGVKAVIIATPITTHYKLAKDCLNSGKHVLIEKEITNTSEEALELVRIAKEKNLILMVGHIFNYNPAIEKLKKYIDEKQLGDILYLYSSRTGLGPIRDDINAMWDLASHDISIFLNLLKNVPSSVIAAGASYIKNGREDVVFLNFKFPVNIIANVHVSWLDPHKIRRLIVVGSKKMAVFDDISFDQKVVLYDKGVDYNPIKDADGIPTYGEFQLSLRDGDIHIPKVENKEPLKEEIKHFMECINQNKKPKTDGYNAYKIVRILEAANESLKTKKEIKINFENEL